VFDFIGAAASVGFATLGITSLMFSSFILFGWIPNVLQTEDRLIPKPEKMDKAAADAVYARQQRSAEDVAEYAEILTDMGMEIGLTLRFPTEILKDDVLGKKGTPEQDTVVGQVDVAYLRLGKGETEDDRLSVRAVKRRYNLAAKSLNFDELSWREPQGWLIGRVVRTLAERKAEDAAAKEADDKAAAEAQAVTDSAEDEDDLDEEEDEPQVRTVASNPSRPARRRR